MISIKKIIASGSFVLTCSLIALPTFKAFGEQASSNERTQSAIGHYAKARALLVEALEEFEIARKIARPDLLLDSEEWRISVVARTEELNRILDPQPRITRSGSNFQSDNRLVTPSGKAKKQSLVKPSNTYEEEMKQGGSITPIRKQTTNKKEKTQSADSKPKKIKVYTSTGSKKPTVEEREASENPFDFTDKPSEPGSGTKILPEDDKNRSKDSTSEEINLEDVNQPTQEATPSPTSKKTDQKEPPAGNKNESAGVVEEMKKEDPAVADAIEKVIGERIKKMKEEQDKEAAKPKASGKTVDGLFSQYGEQ